MDFLNSFFFDDGKMAIGLGGVYNVKFVDEAPVLPVDIDVYFSPAMHNAEDTKKTSVMGSKFVWVDIDDAQKPVYTLPPTFMVFSGHGWHLYWALKEPITELEELESINQILVADIQGADKACWNANRWMRVPGTTNTKEEPVAVELRTTNDVVYSVEDFGILNEMSRKLKHKIRTGDTRGYESRSERDFAIIRELTVAGANEDLIKMIFSVQSCGDKVRDEETAATYLDRTIAKAKTLGPKELPFGLSQREDGYYYQSGRGVSRISTFTFDPKLLLDGSRFEAEDAIVGDVGGSDYKWENITFTRSAFTSVARLDKECPVAAWQWLGRDETVRRLLPFLMEQLKSKGLPKIEATPMMGLFFDKDEPLFIADKQVVTREKIVPMFEAPIAWLPSKKEHPELELELGKISKKMLAEELPKINEPEVFWTMLGWYAATMFKPWLESKGLRFPILNVTGTRGSGKTTLIQRVFMPLFGQINPKSYDAGTTRFVMLAVLGSSNAIPIAFSEFRYDTVEKFLRYILLSYDTGHDPRGKADQTTVDYPLSAPFSVDGEDLIADPAARERIVVAALHPDIVGEGKECYKAYGRIREHLPGNFAGSYIRFGLESLSDGRASAALQWARAAVFRVFPEPLPDRVRNNHIVVAFGTRMFTDCIGADEQDTSFLERSISSVFNIDAGRARTMVDDFVEDVANAIPEYYFKWQTDALKGQLWFQMATTYSWWVGQRRRTGRGSLGRDAIVTQFQEAPYSLQAENRGGIWMYGIDVTKAVASGLDIPDTVKARVTKASIP